MQPFDVTEQVGRFDVFATLAGGGISAQAEALRHGISKALLEYNAGLRDRLKRAGFLTRDARAKERKKYGQPGARKRFSNSPSGRYGDLSAVEVGPERVAESRVRGIRARIRVFP